MSNDLTNTSEGNTMLSQPSYLDQLPISADDFGLGNLNNYVSSPFIKVVQTNAKPPYDEYEPGTVLVVPLMQELFRPGQIFHITPLFFYPEYVLTNPFMIKSLPFARERSLDPKSELAAKCKDFENRAIPCPEAPAGKENDSQYQCKYYEHLNFVCAIHESDVFRVNPPVFTFRSSEFKTGKKLAGLISMRNKPICSTRFQAYTGPHKTSGDDVYGFNFDNPGAEGMSPWCDEGEFNTFWPMHKQLVELHASGRIQTDLEAAVDAPSDEVPADAPAM